jgi:hypothetical protein
MADDATRLLEADGIRVRLDSMPRLDRFAWQDGAHRDFTGENVAARARAVLEAIAA